MSADLKVVPLGVVNFLNPSALLRKIADDVDAGKYGEIGCIAVALLGDQMEVFAAGPDSEGPSAAVLLHAAFMRLTRAIEDHGR